MFLHLRIPGFHAAVHQACSAGLRGRPVAVAVDASDHAPLFATSIEARAQGIWPGLRSAAAKRRCPVLTVVVPDPDLYRRAQHALAEYANTATPRVGGRAGSLDLDLEGTERLWVGQSGTSDSLGQAEWWAHQLNQRIGDGLHLPTRIGVSSRIVVARLAASATDHADAIVVVIKPGTEAQSMAAWPTRWITELTDTARQTLDGCGITTLGDLWRLGISGLEDLLGGDAVAPLVAVLNGLNEPVVPYLTDPEPEVTVSRHAGDRGADANRALAIMSVLARDLGYRLRELGLACTRLTVSGSQLDGKPATRTLQLKHQLQHDAGIAAVAERLLEPLTRRVSWQRITLTGSGLCTAEDQQDLFAPPKALRLERARDRLRTRFGTEIVHVAATAG